ncbi:MAG: hypothetical protein H6718_13690 [Polyangiaceae bacterium]|nr:hypothetical protein [Polyangiaceae bacterium]
MIPFIVVGMLLVAYGVWNRKRQELLRWVAPIIIGVILAALGAVDTVASQGRHEALYRAYAEGRCEVVEGVVHLEHEEPIDGHDIGEFGSVGDASFNIGHSPAYGTTVAHGGLLREGEWFRVWVYAGAVLRIDRPMEADAPASATPTSVDSTVLE